jgi:hypothetical protein
MNFVDAGERCGKRGRRGDRQQGGEPQDQRLLNSPLKIARIN